MEQKKILIATILIMIIAGFAGYIIINGENIFKNEAYIKYSDDCVENYTNGELVSAECEIGRLLQEERKEKLRQRYSGQDLGMDYEWDNTTNKLIKK